MGIIGQGVGDKASYQGKTGTIREIEGRLFRVDFGVGDKKWIHWDNLAFKRYVPEEIDRPILKQLCDLQEKHLEHKIKTIHDGRLNAALEANNDVFRELTCKGGQGTFISPQYIKENTCLMARHLHKLGVLGMKVPKSCKL